MLVIHYRLPAMATDKSKLQAYLDDLIAERFKEWKEREDSKVIQPHSISFYASTLA
jgi:hypothetical protein